MPEMRTRPLLFSWWPGVLVVASAYVYFLIFAQFAFLRLVREGGSNSEQVRLVMACMGLAGVLASLCAGFSFSAPLRRFWLSCGFAAGGCAVVFAFLGRGFYGSCAVGALIGASLGILTVGVASRLPHLLGARGFGLKAGIATGAAYAVCNIPGIFAGSVMTQAIVAGVACLVGLVFLPFADASRDRVPFRQPANLEGSFGMFVLVLMALVWLDSAAFYILQNAPDLNRHAWATGALQWQNGCVHLIAAVVAGFWIDRAGSRLVPLAAFALLAVAVAFLGSGGQLLRGAHLFYAAGVSLYSTALVVVPWLRDPDDPVGTARRAGVLFGVAGWIGSALGVGMALDLKVVPWWFLLAAGLLVAVGSFRFGRLSFKGRPVRLVMLCALLVIGTSVGALDAAEPSVEWGREVYISEGCIHCHSQYVRPDTHDVEWWGPAHTTDSVLAEKPPLIGNRRQGPDLLNVGNRRSPQWNRLHLMRPREVAPGSVMPSYAYLFRAGDGRGPSLLRYLESLGKETAEERKRAVAAWRPSVVEKPDPVRGGKLFRMDCAQCHGVGGTGNGPLVEELGGWRPRDLTLAQWTQIPPGASHDEVLVGLARVVKYGIAGTPMAGHEYFGDRELADLATYVSTLSAPNK